jgi:F-type H+-transporting ATPase subunit gamma
MANRRALVKRRKAVTNTRKITRTMQLIATARFQAAMSRATASKPYSEKLAEMIRDLSSVAEETRHPLMQTRNDVDRAALLVLTSNRGLCGSYNANVLRAALAHIKAGDRPTDVHMVGKKGESFFRFQEQEMEEVTKTIDDKPRFDQVQPIADQLMDRFENGEIASAHVAYTRFYSPGKQKAEIVQLLPLVDLESEESSSGEEGGGYQAEYEFMPSPEELLNQLLPASVRMRLFQCFNDAAVSEQIARMVAMKAATEAAGDMIKNLTREYNRARQTHITMELLDIVGGANALA